MEAWVTLTALAQATRADPDRNDGARDGVPPSGGAREHGGHARHRVRRSSLELGLGAGWNEEECDASGIELDGLSERFDRFDEACDVITRLLTQRRPTSTAATFTCARPGTTRRPSSARTCRSASAGRDRVERCRPLPGGPSTGTTPDSTSMGSPTRRVRSTPRAMRSAARPRSRSPSTSCTTRSLGRAPPLPPPKSGSTS